MTSESEEMTATGETIFAKYMLCEPVSLEGRYLNRNVKQSVENRLRNQVEGICSRHGFIKPGSVNIRSINDGKVTTDVGGRACFMVRFDAHVCNPLPGSIITCRIEAVNSFAAFAVNATDGMRVLEVIVPPSPAAFKHEVPFASISVSSIVRVRIVGKRFHLGQKTVVCAGQMLSIDTKPSVKNEDPHLKAKAPIEDPDDESDAPDHLNGENDDAATEAQPEDEEDQAGKPHEDDDHDENLSDDIDMDEVEDEGGDEFDLLDDEEPDV